MVERFERFLYDIATIDRYWHKIANEEMEKYGLKGPYAIYFTTLHQYPEGVTAARLAELCNRNKADVSRAMATMEEKELIVRTSSTTNSYRAQILLTPSGKKLALEICSKVMTTVTVGGEGLTEEEKISLYHSLEIIADNLQKISNENNTNKKCKNGENI